MMRTVNVIFALRTMQSDDRTKRAAIQTLKNIVEKEGQCVVAQTVFASSKDEVDSLLREGKYDVLISSEELPDRTIGAGSVVSWMKIHPLLTVFLLVSPEKKSGLKLHGLYVRDFYNAIYLNDQTVGKIISDTLMGRQRTKEEAYDYYGLASVCDKDGNRYDQMEKLGPVESPAVSQDMSVKEDQPIEAMESVEIPKQSLVMDDIEIKVPSSEPVSSTNNTNSKCEPKAGEKGTLINEVLEPPFKPEEPDYENGETVEESIRNASIIETLQKEHKIVRTIFGGNSLEEKEEALTQTDDMGSVIGGLFDGVGDFFGDELNIYEEPIEVAGAEFNNGTVVEFPGASEKEVEDVEVKEVIEEQTEMEEVVSEGGIEEQSVVPVSAAASISAGLPGSAILTNVVSDTLAIIKMLTPFEGEQDIKKYRFVLMFSGISQGTYKEDGKYETGTISIVSFGNAKIDSDLFIIEAPDGGLLANKEKIVQTQCIVLVAEN